MKAKFQKFHILADRGKKNLKMNLKNYKVRKIKSYFFKDFLKKYKIDNKLAFHLIKIDAEGYDFQI